MKAKDFITIWQQAKNKDEIRQKTGMTDHAINARAVRYRKLGINLKDFRALNNNPSAIALNVPELVKLAESLVNGKEQ